MTFNTGRVQRTFYVDQNKVTIASRFSHRSAGFRITINGEKFFNSGTVNGKWDSDKKNWLDNARKLAEERCYDEWVEENKPAAEPSLQISKPIKITVCADGFVSIRFAKHKARLGAGLPCHSTNTVEEALELINKICTLTVCTGKDGCTVEPRAPVWLNNQDIEQLYNLGVVFQYTEEQLNKSRGQ